MTHVITRFPPSPTGYFHIGSARTALFNYLFAKNANGSMRFRFEDTDRARNKPEFEDDILEGLRWLDIEYEGDVWKQSQRFDVYRTHIRRLIDEGKAYEAEATTDDPSKKVVRFKNPGTNIVFRDLIRGEVSFDTTELKDFVIAKHLDEPLYHFTVVVDDHDMGVTHVVRGEDHISNTPRQILILEALGFKRPVYAHIPLILAPDRSKLSKRHGAVSVNEYRAMGFLPEAFVNYLALLGWNPGGEREVFTMEELVKLFHIENVHKSGAVFDLAKLTWLNHEHLRALSDEEFGRRLSEFAGSLPDRRALPLLKDRARTLKEAKELIESGEFDFLNETISYEPHLLLKGAKTDAASAARHLTAVAAMLQELPESEFGHERLKEMIFPYATQEGRGAVLWPLRVALSGAEKSPDPFVVASLIGKEVALRRIEKAISSLTSL